MRKERIMEIQVQCTDGDTSCFAITDGQLCLDLIESIKLSDFFTQPLLRIQAGKRTCVFNMKTVESIYFATSFMVKTREQSSVKNIRTILKKEYLETPEALRHRYEPLENMLEPGQSIDTLVALHGVSGKTHYLHVEIIAGHRLEQLMDLHHRLQRLTSVIPCSPEGYIAINPSNIKKIEIYPAPPETMHTAWLVK
jgi:hypothetical protein